MAISKGRQGREAQNTVRVYVANLRLKGVTTDVLITAYEPIHIKSRRKNPFCCPRALMPLGLRSSKDVGQVASVKNDPSGGSEVETSGPVPAKFFFHAQTLRL